jgi:hypothetical protein
MCEWMKRCGVCSSRLVLGERNRNPTKIKTRSHIITHLFQLYQTLQYSS